MWLDFKTNMYANTFPITLPLVVFNRDRMHRRSSQTERLTKQKRSVKPVCHSFFFFFFYPAAVAGHSNDESYITAHQ